MESPATLSRHFGRFAFMLLAGLVAWIWGPSFFSLVWPRNERVADFFQDWSTASNYWHDLPIYTDQRRSLERYLGFPWDPASPLLTAGSTRPPTAVLLTIPLGLLPYRTAFRLWNILGSSALVVSLIALCRSTPLSISKTAILVTASLLLAWNPLRVQLYQGQWSLLLFFLIVAIWKFEKTARWNTCGICIGLAAAIKFFPAFLLLPFLLRRQWSVLLAAAACLTVLNAVAILLFGIETYGTYWNNVMPGLQPFKGHSVNASLAGFWHRLFDPAVEPRSLNVRALYHAPALAYIATVVSCLIVVALLVRAILRSAGIEGPRNAVACCVTAMLLVSPLTWDHYLVMTLLPAAVAWQSARPGGWCRHLLAISAAMMFFPPTLIHYVLHQALVGPRDWTFAALSGDGAERQWIATPLDAATILSTPLYAMLILFGVGLDALQQSGLSRGTSPTDSTAPR